MLIHVLIIHCHSSKSQLNIPKQLVREMFNSAGYQVPLSSCNNKTQSQNIRAIKYVSHLVTLARDSTFFITLSFCLHVSSFYSPNTSIRVFSWYSLFTAFFSADSDKINCIEINKSAFKWHFSSTHWLFVGKLHTRNADGVLKPSCLGWKVHLVYVLPSVPYTASG